MDQHTDMTEALRHFEATEANLLKIERLWEEIRQLIPEGVSFMGDSPGAIEYETKAGAFRAILKHMPLIEGSRIEDRIMPLDGIAYERHDAWGLEDVDAQISARDRPYDQGAAIRQYRARFDRQRRMLVRRSIEQLLPAIESDLRQFTATTPEMPHLGLCGPEWDQLTARVQQLAIWAVRFLGPRDGRT